MPDRHPFIGRVCKKIIIFVQMKQMLAYLLLILTFWSAGAQTGLRVGGRVKDARTREPVVGALVRLDSDYLLAVTGEDGRFLLRDVHPDGIRWK